MKKPFPSTIPFISFNEQNHSHLTQPSFFHVESSVNVVPQGYHSHVSSKLLSVRVIINQIAKT